MLGLAATGLAVAEALSADGIDVVVIDERPGPQAQINAQQLETQGVSVLLAPDAQAVDRTLDTATLVVPSPGLTPTHPMLVDAARRGIPVRSEIDIAAERIHVPLVAITGTNGKTTTTELVTAMLRASGLTVACGGNIGTPLVSLCSVPSDVVVAEVSSFQLHFTTSAWKPNAATVLNIADDHLDWHGGFPAYRAAKARVFAHQSPNDTLVLNHDDPEVRGLAADARARVEWVTTSAGRGWHVADGALRRPDDSEIVPLVDLPRTLPHDLTNSLAASALAEAARATSDAVRATLESYVTLPHRVQFIGENGGVRYYDDSKATNPHAAVRAVSAFDSVVLLAGGLNKGLDLSALREGEARIRGVVAFGAAADEVVAAFEGHRPVVRATSMRDIVRTGAAMARPGDAVLLSPGCASFDMYPGGYTDRGDDFAAEVRRLLEEEHA